MCRMVMLWGDFVPEFESIFKSLAEVAESDPLSRNRPFSHRDGWGYLNISKDRLDLMRYGSPLTLRTNIPRPETGAAIIHARAAAEGEGMGILNAHPFHLQDDKYDVYLSHNGWFDKYEMNKSLRLDGVKNMNDTEVFLKLIMSQNGQIESRLMSALNLSRESGYLKGGVNIFIISIERSTNETTILYHSDVGPGRDYTEYEKLYQLNGRKWKGVMSSSLKESKFFPKELKFSELERGRVYADRIRISG